MDQSLGKSKANKDEKEKSKKGFTEGCRKLAGCVEAKAIIMGDKTGITWCNKTFNPWIGCARVSEGCENCYAEHETNSPRFRRFSGLWGPNAERRLTGDSYWKQPLAWNKKAEKEGTRPFVFVGSWCDVCDPKAPDLAACLLFELIQDTPNLFWLLLTKRPERFKDILPNDWGGGWDNVMLMTTAENQQRADERVPILLDTPCMFRGLSIEPMLGPIDLNLGGDTEWKCPECNSKDVKDINLHDDFGLMKCNSCGYTGSPGEDFDFKSVIDWVIVGGESGPNARPMHPDWARSICDQCRDAGVPFFLKQWGEWVPEEMTTLKGCPSLSKEYYGDKTNMIRVGKKQAGDFLDGKQHHEFPEVTR